MYTPEEENSGLPQDVDVLAPAITVVGELTGPVTTPEGRRVTRDAPPTTPTVIRRPPRRGVARIRKGPAPAQASAVMPPNQATTIQLASVDSSSIERLRGAATEHPHLRIEIATRDPSLAIVDAILVAVAGTGVRTITVVEPA